MMISRVFLGVLVCAGLSMAGSFARAESGEGSPESVSSLVVAHPYAYATAQGRPNGAVFMVLTNTGEEDDVLVSAHSDVSETVELHTHILEDGVMMMRRVDSIPVPVGETPTVLEPAGYHVMLIGLKEPLTEGETFPLTLVFESAGAQDVPVKITPAGVSPMQSTGKDAEHTCHEE